MTTMQIGPFLRPREIAEQLGISSEAVLRWIRVGVLPATKVAGSYFVREDDLRKVLDKGRTC